MSSFSKMCGHCKDIMECPNGFSTSFFAGTGKSIYYHDGCLIDMFHWITKKMNKEKLDKDIKDAEMRTGWKATEGQGIYQKSLHQRTLDDFNHIENLLDTLTKDIYSEMKGKEYPGIRVQYRLRTIYSYIVAFLMKYREFKELYGYSRKR